MDQELRRYGKNVPADTVHHIFPVEDYPQYRWCDWNLVSVSAATHNDLHNRNTGELSEKGLDMLKRMARKRGIKYGGEESNKETGKESTEERMA